MEIKKKGLSLEKAFAIIAGVIAIFYCVSNILVWATSFSRYLVQFIEYGSSSASTLFYFFDNVLRVSIRAEIITDTFVVFALYFIFKGMGKDKKWLLGMASFLFALLHAQELFGLTSYYSYDVSVQQVLNSLRIACSVYALIACVIIMLYGFDVLKKAIFPVIGSGVLIAIWACEVIISMVNFSSFSNLEYYFDGTDIVSIMYGASLGFNWIMAFFYACAVLAFTIVLLLYFIKTMEADKERKKQEQMSSIRIINDTVPANVPENEQEGTPREAEVE